MMMGICHRHITKTVGFQGSVPTFILTTKSIRPKIGEKVGNVVIHSIHVKMHMYYSCIVIVVSQQYYRTPTNPY